MRALIPRCAALALTLVLGACATLSPPPPLPQLASIPEAFEMSGRIAIRQGERSEIAKLRWTRRKGSDLWVIASPLGNEVARIESSPHGATLLQAGGTPQEAPDFQALTGRILGVALDPALLAAWLHGQAPAQAPSEWKFTVDETQPAGAVQLAKRITATRGDVTVKLVVDTYQPLAE